jgi:hypothetical protein
MLHLRSESHETGPKKSRQMVRVVLGPSLKCLSLRHDEFSALSPAAEEAHEHAIFITGKGFPPPCALRIVCPAASLLDALHSHLTVHCLCPTSPASRAGVPNRWRNPLNPVSTQEARQEDVPEQGQQRFLFLRPQRKEWPKNPGVEANVKSTGSHPSLQMTLCRFAMNA